MEIVFSRLHIKDYKITLYVLSMKSKQNKIMASAPMESLSICSFCINSQFVPMYPSIHRHTYGTSEFTVSRLWHTPPFLQGLSKHSFRSTHDFPSGVTLCPLAQLYKLLLVDVKEKCYKGKVFIVR